METYRVRTVVERDGSVLLSGLPPDKSVEILVFEQSDFPEEIDAWLLDIRHRHPFARMDKDEILKILRTTRELVWTQRREG